MDKIIKKTQKEVKKTSKDLKTMLKQDVKHDKLIEECKHKLKNK
jgi:hypothetical protein